jgi:EXS family
VRLCPQDTRLFFSRTLSRVATPFREVTWADFLLADFLTSLAKPLSDTERALCHMLTGPVMDPSPRVGSPSRGHQTWPCCGKGLMCSCCAAHRLAVVVVVVDTT